MDKAMINFKIARTKLLLNKHSPEILLVGGLISVVTSAIWASYKSATKTPVYMLKKDVLLTALEADTNLNNELGPEDISQAKLQIYGEFGFDLLRLYGPPALLMSAGIAMLIGSNRILTNRNLALAGLFTAVEAAYERYRGRVRDELGEEVDEYLLSRKRKEGLQVLDAKKKPVKWNEIEAALPGELTDTEDDEALGLPSMYAVIFDEKSPQWRTNNEFNEFFLRAQENYCNDKLHMEGHVFLNEVYDALGVKRTKEGAIVGWVDGNGDDYISFDIYNPYNSLDGQTIKPEGYLVLDFNVDGLIFDLI